MEILVIAVAGLFILGPDRLPSAAAWVGRNLRRVREYATGARDQLRSELGPEFDELRKPLQDLQQLRGFDPKRAVAKHLFDDDPVFTNGTPLPPVGTPTSVPTPPRDEKSLNPGERPPIDPDAT